MMEASIPIKCPVCRTPIQTPMTSNREGREGGVFDVTLEWEGMGLHLGLAHPEADV